MNPFNSALILLAAFVTVFLQAATTFFPRLLGVQVDLLPALMVYASLTAGAPTIALLAMCGGLWFDSLSADPLGISVLPLLGIGCAILARRELILRDQAFAQIILGLAASSAAPVCKLLLMLSAGREPLIGWGTVWQLLVMTAAGGVATPLLFRLFNLVTRNFDYREAVAQSFRPDREIRRGRN
jgi:rod shape-determining protein MreD